MNKKRIEESKFHKAIYHISSILSSSNNPDMNSLLQNLSQYTGFDRISIYGISRNECFLKESLNNSKNKNPLPAIITLTDQLSKYVEEANEVYINDTQGNNEMVNYLKSNINSEFLVYLPIIDKDKQFDGFFLFENIDNPTRWDYENYKILKNISYSYSSYLGRKKAEDFAEESAKFSALGEISAGIAHEINNPLAIIHGQASIIQMIIMSARDDIHRLNLDDLEINNKLLLDTVERADKIINGLRYFVKNDESNPFVHTEIDSILDTVQILSIDRFKKSGILITVDKTSIPKNFKIECKPTQIAQVLINLINNSYDAIKDTNDKWIKIKLDIVKSQLVLSVTDSGLGISPALGEKILQKFFTTKVHSKTSGSGLGLSISKRIIDLHGGCLSIDYSSKHTKFDIVLPLVQNQADTFNSSL